MEYLPATERHIDPIYHLVQETIKTVYPACYPPAVVDFFCRLHNRDAIAKDVADGGTYLLLQDGRPVGTGCVRGRHITRVYVSPACQGQGYGSYIMRRLETSIAAHSDTVVLDASLPAHAFYAHRGYRTVRQETCPVGGGVTLTYDVMEKKLSTAE